MSGEAQLRAAFALVRSAVRPERPDRIGRNLLTTALAGPSLAGLVYGAAARYPTTAAVVDAESGERTSYADLMRCAHHTAHGLRKQGVGERATVGLLADNGLGFVVTLLASSILGADIVLLNTGFAGPQLADVAQREGVTHMIYEARFSSTVEVFGQRASWCHLPVSTERGPLLTAPILPSRRPARLVILTSGTTGQPKGAQRTSTPIAAIAGMLSIIPIRSGDTIYIPAPLFHAWGFAHAMLTLSLASTLVVSARFEPDHVASVIERERVDGVVAVPAILQRVLAAAGDGTADLSSLRYVASSGSAIHPALVRELLEFFGPVLYNTYGSTEAALATIASPDDLAVFPATAGRIVPGVAVRIVDADGDDRPPGVAGRIFVDAGGGFDGYTGGGDKERLGRFVSTGDIGRLEAGLLYIDGRDDDMIVSGGENVFPGEVEAVIAKVVGVADVAVVGVPDDDFGQRLAAFVVKEPGREVSKAAIKTAVGEELARFKVPRDVTFVRSLPRTETGKIRRGDLAGSS